MTNTLELTFVSGDMKWSEPVAISDLIIGGWTGRDKAKLEEHIVELEALGVARPISTPCFSASSRIVVTLPPPSALSFTSSESRAVRVAALPVVTACWKAQALPKTARIC